MNTLHIEPIKLKSGTHADTAQTGSGCFMNVIAYLNGEPQITDQSPCVCATVRPLAIWLNDFLKDDERNLLIPYIERAMGSVTDDKAELIRRALLAVDFAKYAAGYAAGYAAAAAKYAAGYAAGYAAAAAKHAAVAAGYAADAAAGYAEFRENMKTAAFLCLDGMLRDRKPVLTAEIAARAEQLCALAAA